MTRGAVALLGLAACWRAPAAPEPALGNRAEPAPAEYTISERGAGPIDETTEATVGALQRKLRPLRVMTRDLGPEAGIVFDVFEGKDRLFYVVPDDEVGWTDDSGEERRYAKTIFSVFAVSPRVRVIGRPWRIGDRLRDASGLDMCECWGDGEVTACYQDLAHLAIVFEESCAAAEAEGVQAMVGKPIARVMWRRTKFELEPDLPNH